MRKWHGGALGSNGAIYGIPSHGERVLKIQPETGEVTTIGSLVAVRLINICNYFIQICNMYDLIVVFQYVFFSLYIYMCIATM